MAVDEDKAKPEMSIKQWINIRMHEINDSAQILKHKF